jgi:hypothetical protein
MAYRKIHICKIRKGEIEMAVKLSNKNEAEQAAPSEVVAQAVQTAPSEVVAQAVQTAPKNPEGKKMVTLQGKKIVPTSGVFMIFDPNGTYKYIGVSTRIEVCVKDYFKWLTDGKHGNAEMQTAFEKAGKKFEYKILKECPKDSFNEEKAKACKEFGIDLKVPFSKEVIKAEDIKV